MKDCIFCQIIKKEIPAQIVYQDKEILVFKDIQPKAKFHFLIISKEHISSLNEAKNETILGKLLWQVKELAKKLSLDKLGYKVIINSGSGAGQTVFHLHLHLLAGEELKNFTI